MWVMASASLWSAAPQERAALRRQLRAGPAARLDHVQYKHPARAAAALKRDGAQFALYLRRTAGIGLSP